MSKLYLTAESDSRKTPITTRGHNRIETNYFYGSAKGSKLAGRVSITDQGGFYQFLIIDKDGKIRHSQSFSK